jgi:parallel beta-helix repeat protein
VSDSTSTNNGRSGFALTSVPSDPSTGNRFHNNTATGNREAGIKVVSAATQNAITGNTAQNNSPVDMQDENLPNCVNKWSGNTFGTDNEGDGPGAGCIR